VNFLSNSRLLATPDFPRQIHAILGLVKIYFFRLSLKSWLDNVSAIPHFALRSMMTATPFNSLALGYRLGVDAGHALPDNQQLDTT